MKAKIFVSSYFDELEDKLNLFLKNVEYVDLKFNCTIQADKPRVTHYAVLIYKEKSLMDMEIEDE